MRPAPPSWGSLKRKQPENAVPAAAAPSQAADSSGQQAAAPEGSGQVGSAGGSGDGAECNDTKQVGGCLRRHLWTVTLSIESKQPRMLDVPICKGCPALCAWSAACRK